jgi:long-subunit fatty acid transport protein
VATGFGQFAKVGTSGLQFMDIPVSARAVGMGNTFVAVANDASTLFINPAGMENIPSGEVYASYVKWPADINLSAFGGSYNIEGIGHIGVNLLYLDVGLMNMTDVYNPAGNGATFGVEDWAVGLSYSRSLTERFALGGTIKMVHEKLGDFKDDGWSVDLGGFYKTGFRDITVGFSILNFGPDFEYKVDNDGDGKINEDKRDGQDNDGDGLKDEDPREAGVPLPIAFRFGVSMPLVQTEENSLLLAGEIIHPNDNKENYNLGAEYWYNSMFALRGGYNVNLDQGSGFFAGAGFKLNVSGMALKLDYAFADMGILDIVHRASIGFSL